MRFEGGALSVAMEVGRRSRGRSTSKPPGGANAGEEDFAWERHQGVARAGERAQGRDRRTRVATDSEQRSRARCRPRAALSPDPRALFPLTAPLRGESL